MNFNDIDIIRGRYLTLPLEPPFVPGMESVGVVESAGAGAEHLVGQRVVGIPVMAHGGYASYAVIDAATALGIPAGMSSVDGAALHYPFHLGWFALHERGRLHAGETLLVHAAAGGIGSGVLQIGKALGARVIATAGSDEKVALCRELGADHAINYRRDDFVAVVEELTYGRGVDVAFDTVGGTVTEATFKCMGMNGRHLIAGFSQDIQLEDGAFTPRPSRTATSTCVACVSSTSLIRSVRAAPLASIGRRAPKGKPRTRRSWNCCALVGSAQLWAAS